MASVFNGKHDSEGKGKRYAILVSGGTSCRRHLNDLEYCYRMLRDHYGLPDSAIRVLFFTGDPPQLDDDGAPVYYPDESTTDRYRLPISGKGKRPAFQDACTALNANLKPDDVVFVMMTGHGYLQGANAYLLEPSNGRYYAAELCDDLAMLLPHASLLILMQQCYSIGFIEPILEAYRDHRIKAGRVSIACASSSYSGFDSNGLFDCFASGWIAAHLNEDPWGNTLPAGEVAHNNSGYIEAYEAYDHGEKCKHTMDDPQSGDEPQQTARVIRLA
jgi:hypothetical protein